MKLFERIQHHAVEGPYLTRVFLTPYTRWGQLVLHIFHHPDMDVHPHDHPFEFWTLPLCRGYIEEILDMNGRFTQDWVPGWTWTRRRTWHTHRVRGQLSGRWPMRTLVWRQPRTRSWGFWVPVEEAEEWGLPPERWKDVAYIKDHETDMITHLHVPWRDYVEVRGH